MKHLVLFILAIGILLMTSFAPAQAEPVNAYSFTFHALEGGGELPLSAYRGKVLLVVNTASKCGFTPQYNALEKLYEEYQARGLIIVGVPSNDFGGQEPGSAEEIAHFCSLNYGVTFPMASKEHVKGDEAHPFYKWAREEKGFLGAPKWNFHKYLIDRNGNLVDYFHSNTKPDDAKLTAAIEQLLDQPAGQ